MRRALLGVFGIGVVILGLAGASWYYETYRRPLAELRELLGVLPDGARAVGYLNDASVRGGTLTWNIMISDGAARILRGRCKENATILPLVRLRVAESDAGASSHGSVAGISQGCLLASRDEANGNHADAVLGEHLIQLTVALD